MSKNPIIDKVRKKSQNISSRILGTTNPQNLQAGSTRSTRSTPALDPETLQEIDDIRLATELALAEHSQRVGVAEANAQFERDQIARELGITQDVGAIARPQISQSYGDLNSVIQGLIPQTEQTYSEGVQGVTNAYGSGVENLQTQGDPGAELIKQLQALSGSPVVDQNYSQPLQQFTQLLQEGGAVGSANLQALGEGDVQSFREMIPGYEQERNRELSDLDLELAAQIAELNNRRAQVRPEFIPFNLGELQLRANQSIRDAIARGQSRQEEEQPYQGLSGVQRYLNERGRQNLYPEFLNMLSAANEGIPTGGFVDPETGAIMDQQTMDPTQALYSIINSRKQVPDRFVSGTGRRRIQEERDLLRELVDIYSGNY